jgi:hypothetical protein
MRCNVDATRNEGIGGITLKRRPSCALLVLCMLHLAELRRLIHDRQQRRFVDLLITRLQRAGILLGPAAGTRDVGFAQVLALRCPFLTIRV